MHILVSICVVLVLAATGFAADVAVVHQPSRTTVGTQNFTVAGFGTPKGAMCVVGGGATNGTAATHGLLAVGLTDGTRQNAASLRTQSGVTTTVTGRRADTADVLLLVDETQTVIMRAQFSAWITDGVQLTYSVAPGTARPVSCTLFGGSGVTNAYANIVTTPATIDTGTTVSTVGFKPDVILAIINGDGTYNDTNQAHSDISVGFMLCGASNPHVQKSTSWVDINGVTTTALSAMSLSANVGRSSNGTQRVEFQDCTSSGFTAMTRTTGAASTVGYLALKLNGITASLVPVDSPTVTGSSSITGLAGTPQWGMLVMNGVSSVDAQITTSSAEVFGLSSFTATTQSCFAVSSTDGVTTSASDSLVDIKPVCLRKGGVDYANAGFTSFSAGAATFNYTVTDPTIRKWAGLFFSQPLATTIRRRGVILLP